jgi:hypothetical protein
MTGYFILIGILAVLCKSIEIGKSILIVNVLYKETINIQDRDEQSKLMILGVTTALLSQL